MYSFQNTDPSLYNQYGGYQNFQQQFAAFQQAVQNQNGFNPQAIIQQKLNSGEISQAQLNDAIQRVGMMTGQKMF